MKQLLKTVLHEEAKQAALDKLDDETCVIIVEWAHEFLLLKYRETMCEFPKSILNIFLYKFHQ